MRARYEARLDEIGAPALHAHLAVVDPAAARTILDTDGRRIVRALEVVEITGRPFAASAPTIGEPRWGTTIIGIDRERSELDERVRTRTAAMFRDGLVAEVDALCGIGLRQGRTASQAIGYSQVLAHLDGEYDLETAQERTYIGTRQYVRRQRSWFRRDHRVVWFDAASPTLEADVLPTVELAPNARRADG